MCAKACLACLVRHVCKACFGSIQCFPPYSLVPFHSSRQTVPECQVLQKAKEFYDKYMQVDRLKLHQGFSNIADAMTTAQSLLVSAFVLKAEAMLVTAAKCKVKKTQLGLIEIQMSHIAAIDEVDESMIEPNLLSWAKSLLD